VWFVLYWFGVWLCWFYEVYFAVIDDGWFVLEIFGERVFEEGFQ
jgi:hypothetical protein